MITLYSNVGCPKCEVLKCELDNLGVEYETVVDIKAVRKLGYATTPLLVVNEKVMTFPDAFRWVKNGGKEMNV